jgi:hypothetical protein
LPCEIVAQFGVSTGGNTAGQTGLVDGSIVLVGAGIVTLSQATNTNGATVSVVVNEAFGVSTGGNTVGQTGATHGSFVLAGGANITLSQLTNASGATVSILGVTSTAGAAALVVRAGTQDATSGTVVFSNANAISFGMTNSSIVTASYAQSTNGVQAFGVSGGSGNTGTTLGTIALVGSGDVLLSQGTAAGSNATITVSGAGLTVMRVGGDFVSASANRIDLANANGVSFGSAAANQITASIDAGATATGNFGALAAGTQTATSGTVVLSNSNGVSFGMSGSSQITASVAAGATATGNLGALAAGSQTASSGTVVFSNLALDSTNGGVVSFGMAGSSQVTARVLGALANLRISAGTLDTTYRVSAPVGVSNSLQLLWFGNLSHSAADVDTPRLSIQAVAAAAGTQTATVGTAAFADSNGVSFGMSGSSQITASIAAGATATGNLGALAAGTQTATSGTVVFSNSNGVSFGMSGSSRITASYSQSTAPGALAAGSQTATSGTVVFSNSNGVSFGMSGSSQITASYSQSTAPGALAAGTQTATSGTVVFSNSNGVSFGLSGSTRLTASVAPVVQSYLENLRAADLINIIYTTAMNSLVVQRLAVPWANIQATQLDCNLYISNSNNAGATLSFRWGIYTMSGSTASLASSGSRSGAYNSTLAGSSYTDASFWRVWSTPVNWNVTPGEYLVAFNLASASALTAGTYSMNCGRNTQFIGEPYVAQNYSKYFDMGIVNTNGLPNSIELSAITQTGATNTSAPAFPWFKLIGTF